MSEIFHLETAGGIATITWDLPGARMNVLTLDGIRELEGHIDRILADPGIQGAILTSAKPDFAGGMDLSVLARVKAEAAAAPGNPAETVFGFVLDLHRVLRKIERGGADPKTLKGGKPFVWAAPGTALGIGLELGLACHHRIAAETPAARIGLPEVMVGLFPGAGGTTRLIRMLGLMGAGEALLQGKTFAPKTAKGAGLVDAVVPGSELLQAARDWLAEATERDAVKPWDRKGFKIPGGAPFTAEGFEMFLGGVAMAHGRSQGVYPAIRAMLSAIYEGALLPFDQAIRVEARWFTSVLLDPSSEAMIRTNFLSKQALEKGALRPAAVPDRKVGKLGVLGAGMMGAGIAHIAAAAGIEVVLIDRDDAAVERGRDSVAALLAESVGKRRISAEERDATLARLTPTTDYAALSGADLVVEAVFEDAGVKAGVTQRAEAVIPEGAIFATNTSTLPISALARASNRPERFVGIHFFSPVHKMMLVEIIKGQETGPEAVATALDFVRQIRKTPIVVNDARFFYANRCILPYVNEGLIMVTEGVAPALIENVAKGCGMPLGPLQLIDETSLELGHKIAIATRAAMGAAYPKTAADDLLAEMVEGRGRLGRKAKAGLYDYDDKGKRIGLWPGLGTLYPRAATQPGRETVANRLIYAQVLEAVRALEEGVLTDVRAGDVGAVLGWGFMPWSGGPLSWLDRIGAAEAVRTADALAAAHGRRFAPPDRLREMAETGARFYPAEGPRAA